MARTILGLIGLAALLSARGAGRTEATLSLDELRPGMVGEVRTVFSGTTPEPFQVKVVGVVKNAIGPDKSLIVCELTDPRVQSMGATAGMSGSPLYIDGKLVGALSYQLQRFETVRYAGFTPVADLREVRDLTVRGTPVQTSAPGGTQPLRAPQGDFVSMGPVFSIGGLSPEVTAIMEPHFRSVGIQLGALSGNGASAATASSDLVPGSAVAAALSTGDCMIAATGTVSMVDGPVITAFGHPMMGVGEVDLPLCSAEIVTILPSSYSSTKLSNVGATIGSWHQDRLTGISGKLGGEPGMIEVSVKVKTPGFAEKTLHFRVVRHAQLAPMVIASGLMQGVMASNDAGLSEGFRVTSRLEFPNGQSISDSSVYTGSQALVGGLRDLIGTFSLQLYNPYEKVFPKTVSVEVEALDKNPQAVLENFQVSRTVAHAGEPVEATLSWRNYQGAVERQTVTFTAKPEWVGRSLEIALVNGAMLDEATGHSHMLIAARYRSFASFVEAQNSLRASDGLYLVVMEKTALSTDEAGAVPELPSSLERIARQADEARFQRIEAFLPLFESHLMEGLVVSAQVRRPFHVTE